MRVYFGLLGCRLNEAENERWRDQFESAGCTISTSALQADLIVFNSCAVTSEAVRKTRQSVNRLRRDNPSAKIVVSGCAVSLTGASGYQPSTRSTSCDSSADGSSDTNAPACVDLVVANCDKDHLAATTLATLFPDHHIKPAQANKDVACGSTNATETETPNNHSRTNSGTNLNSLSYPVFPLRIDSSSVESRTSQAEKNDATATQSIRQKQRAFLKIQDGCRYKCTYCIVTQARGEERSQSIQALVNEVHAMESNGVQEVVLTGVHVGGYGSDTGESLASLVKALLNDTSIPRIRFASVEPWDLEPAMLQLFDNKRLMPHMHLPLQSGADGVLKRMARRCRTADFKTLVQTLRDQYPDFNVTTDVIVGFPGESDIEWQQTLAFAEEMAFGHIHVFPFSARTGTHAAKLPGQVDPVVKKARAKQLRRLARDCRRSYLETFVGRTMDILWESGKTTSTNKKQPGSTYASTAHRYQGYTANFLRVFVDLPDRSDATAGNHAESLQNKILPATITGLAEDNPSDQYAMLSAKIELQSPCLEI